MKFVKLEKVKDGKYLKNYELTYINKAGREKTYEIVSRKELKVVEDIGRQPSGVSIIATCNDRLLLLHEFRMGVNKKIYNLCAGMLEEGETIEECIARELFEETGLKIKQLKTILPPSYSAVAISDTKTYIAFVEAENPAETLAESLTKTNTPGNEEPAAMGHPSESASMGHPSASTAIGHPSENEEIDAAFYTRDEVRELLETREFSSRAQLAAYYFAYGKEILS